MDEQLAAVAAEHTEIARLLNEAESDFEASADEMRAYFTRAFEGLQRASVALAMARRWRP